MSNCNLKRKKISYIISPTLINHCDKISILKQRASMVHSLIQAYRLTDRMNVITTTKAFEEDIRAFHSKEYVEYIQSADEMSEDEEEEDNFGLGFDCPVFKDMWTTVLEISGATIGAADELISGNADIAINWCGGWHHAQRDSASGFCYVNDIVIAIQRLKSKFDKILYIDLDVHHGDGVENAFLFTPKVLTLSLHQQEPGFFPGTGTQKDKGQGKGAYHTINVPYKSGLNNKQLIYLFESIIYEIFTTFQPDSIVCQCGADALSGDPLGGANITLDGYLSCIQSILNLSRPTLFLGGGGYNKANTAKLWTAITFTILKEQLLEDIPEHQFFPLYGPDFLLEIHEGMRKSENTDKYLDEVILHVLKNLQKLRPTEKEEIQSDLFSQIALLERKLGITSCQALKLGIV